MSSSDTNYQARFRLPEAFQKSRVETIECPIYLNGALVSPDSGTVTIFNESGNAVVSAAVTVQTGSKATYTTSSSTFTNESYGNNWLVQWDLVFSGTTYKFVRDAMLVRRKLFPSITDADLYRRVSVLNPSSANVIHSLTTFQDYIDETFVEIQQRILSKGNRPNLICDNSALGMVHLYLTLAVIFEDFSTRLGPAHRPDAEMYRKIYENEWTRLNFNYDSDNDGMPDVRRGEGGGIWL